MALAAVIVASAAVVKPGIEVLRDRGFDCLQGKRVGLITNPTGVDNSLRSTIDILHSAPGVELKALYSPEHGVRGDVHAGDHVDTYVDPATGVTVYSIYGKSQRPTADMLRDIDVLIYDIQDNGSRSYTFISTMGVAMDVCAELGKEFMVLDRPNPNGMTVDGPILDMKYSSGVGRLPIPIVHGMTLGELAQMANGEGWLKDGAKVPLTVIPCEGYTHQTRYRLPVAPSPNLRTMLAIYLYPSTCYFEATPVSLGRGTDRPFEIYGHPDMKGYGFSFTPRPTAGAKHPPLEGRLCHGADLSRMPLDEARQVGLTLRYVIEAYRNLGLGERFFTPMFEKLIGVGYVREMILSGASEAEIRACWQEDLRRFRRQRQPYLLYAE